MNTAECLAGGARGESERLASMEPPCEHGGVYNAPIAKDGVFGASMEPPCEHGGVLYVSDSDEIEVGCFNGAAV